MFFLGLYIRSDWLELWGEGAQCVATLLGSDEDQIEACVFYKVSVGGLCY